MGKDDVMEVEILEDGTIKVITDQVSMPNHKAADDFLGFVTKAAGGSVTRNKRKQTKTQTQTHVHIGHKHE